ncbi:hypothetical protein CC86DRAFT_139415 [Ophiobolus disseminans]|uniref:Uncharacterized protein n=1 Tax=Ophiobolus disseminans TaxID=1469910 RepID=A0A6A7ADW7_9PLEO|nr:hypothetical protein CC86DRAFT_139415 [Ophiobolus disseminans]
MASRFANQSLGTERHEVGRNQASSSLVARTDVPNSSPIHCPRNPQLFATITMARPITQISDGVIQAPLSTPQPSSALATPAQPAVVTSQPSFVDIPAIGPGIHTLLLPGTGSDVSATRTVVVSANASTTVVINNQSRSTRSSTTTGM